jgi:hypothetical protein
MKISDIEPGYMVYRYVRERDFENFLKNSEFIDVSACLEIVNNGLTEYFPFLKKYLNKYYQSVPIFFMFNFCNYDLDIIKVLIRSLNLKLKGKNDNYTILYYLESCDLERFKLFFDEFKRRNIPIEDGLLEYYIKKNNFEIVSFLTYYIKVKISHIKLALKLYMTVEWFKILKVDSNLYPEILIDTVYNPKVFEFLYHDIKKIIIFPRHFEVLFYDDKFMKIDFAVKFLLDEKVSKPPLEYLSISPLNLNSYYKFELDFIQKLFSEEGIGIIIKRYIIG